MIENKISIFLATFIIIGFFFVALPEQGIAGNGIPPIGEMGCCQLPGEGCEDVDDGRCIPGTFLPNQICNDATGQCIQPVNTPTPIPTLSEWGLISMAGLLGIVGFMVMRRRKVTA